ncbi:MAG: hypothetical protein WC975_07800 [Phycisphaerae bacterium]
MKLPNIDKNYYSIAVAVLAAIMFLDVVYQIQMHVRWRLWIPNSLVADNSTATTKPTLVPPPQLSASLKKRNIFIEPMPKGHGMSLTGVMGTIALFRNRGGQTVGIEEGKSANGITVKSIKNYEVTIEYEGKPETMKLFNDQGQQASMPQAQPAMGGMPSLPSNMSPEDRTRIMKMMKQRRTMNLNRNPN